MRWLEFFEGGGGNRLSMTRLVMFLAFFPSSYVVVIEPSSETLGWYLGAFVLGYVGGKGADIFMDHKQLETGGGSPSDSSGGNAGLSSGQSSVRKGKPRAF